MDSSKLANVILPMAEALQSWVDQNPDSPLPLDCEPLLDLFNLYKLALNLIKFGQDVPRTPTLKSKLTPYSNIKTTPANKAEGICCSLCGHGNMVYTVSPVEVEKENTKIREDYDKRVREQQQAVKKIKGGFVAKKILSPNFLPLILQCQCRNCNCFGMASNNSCPYCIVGEPRVLTGSGSCSCNVCTECFCIAKYKVSF